MIEWLKELGNTTLAFWRNPAYSFPQVAALLASSMLLLLLARAPTFELGAESVFRSLVISLLAFALQAVSGIAYLLRGGHGSALEEGPRFARLLTVAWMLSLVLFLPNFFEATRWYTVIPDDWITAAVHSFAAALLLVYYTVSRERREAAADGGQPCSGIAALLFWAAFVALITTVLFYLFVLDTETDEQIARQGKALCQLFGGCPE